MSIEAMPAARREAAFVVSFEDVTDVRDAARHVADTERVNALDRLAGHVAHDFNNLITVMRGCLDQLDDEGGDEAARSETLVTLRTTTDRATQLTRSLVDLRGQSRAEACDLDLGPFVAALRGTIQHLVGDRIKLDIATASAPTVVRIDPKRLELAILNLAANARDAMPDGGLLAIAVAIATSSGAISATPGRAEHTDAVLLTVRDTGHGMDEATRAHAFDPYFSTKARGRGTGLGLASVHGTVTDAGGEIAIASAPGAGTTVRIRLGLPGTPAPG
jgi:signal transduction histidine kinase